MFCFGVDTKTPIWAFIFRVENSFRGLKGKEGHKLFGGPFLGRFLGRLFKGNPSVLPWVAPGTGPLFVVASLFPDEGKTDWPLHFDPAS